MSLPKTLLENAVWTCQVWRSNVTATRTILEQAHALHEALRATRRDLHTHPELGYQEVRTSNIVKERLESLGYDVKTGIATTGILATKRGTAKGKTVLLRFDMDALPIEEQNDIPYRSQTRGVMHACGHDAHVAIGLGVAEVLAETTFAGTLNLMFQPAEEGLGGALKMIEAGSLEGVDEAYGLHVSSAHPTGTLAVCEGAFMGSTDRLTIQVKGQGGHAALPHQTVDAVVAASHLVVALQSIISRNLDPQEAGVITLGQASAGTAGNIVAGEAVLRGTLRCFTPQVRALLERRVREVCAGIGAAHNARIEVTIERGVNPVINDKRAAQRVINVASKLLGINNVDTTWRTLIGEDFSEVLARVPGCFFFLGARDDSRNLNSPHHSPTFDIDEACLPLGVALLSEIALRTLGES
jgi:amidohydrolase